MTEAVLDTATLGRRHAFNSTKARETLNWTPRPATETVTDCARSLLALRAG